MNTSFAESFRSVEEKWAPVWENYLRGGGPAGWGKFCVWLVPPNVTGNLHLGHALMTAIQDTMLRWERIKGRRVLSLPGADHAGIAAETMVRKEVGRLPPAELRERVRERADEFKAVILEEVRRAGFLCDWDRRRYTLDPGYVRAVLHAFVSLYRAGLIYRGDYLVNWCLGCSSAVSDLEVEEEKRAATVYEITLEGPEGPLSLELARPELLGGLVAVAAHPSDERHTRRRGGARHPLSGADLPLIFDPRVERSQAGLVYPVVPAHDRLSWHLARANGLPVVRVLDETAVAAPGGEREAVLGRLQAAGRGARRRDKTVTVGVCSRCGTPTLNLVANEWFVRLREMAPPIREMIESGRIPFYPPSARDQSLHWIDKMEDWCLSRRISWGQFVPAWYCRGCGREQVQVEEPPACTQCGSNSWEPDGRVLDTWFSSGLWHMAILGWPDDTPDMRDWYPASVIETGEDILFFWVVRTLMLCYFFTGQALAGKVYLHGLVRDPAGRKMSKSHGNTISMREVLDEFGADAMRLTLLLKNHLGRDVRVGREDFAAGLSSLDALWRLGTAEGPGGEVKGDGADHERAGTDDEGAPGTAMSLAGEASPAGAAKRGAGAADDWILSRAGGVAREARRALDRWELPDAARALAQFITQDLSFYLEWAGGRPHPATREALLRAVLPVLHPFCPFLTQELWSRLPGNGDRLILDAGLTAAPPRRPAAEKRLDAWRALAQQLRSLRERAGLRPEVSLRAEVEPWGSLGEEGAAGVGRVAGVSFGRPAAGAERESLLRVDFSGGTAWVELPPEAGLATLKKSLLAELSRLKPKASGLRRTLGDRRFTENAPPETVQKLGRELEAVERELAAVRHNVGAVARAEGRQGGGA